MLTKPSMSRAMLSAAMAVAVAGCSAAPGAREQPWEKANLVQGPPIEDIVTAFDAALGCLRGKIRRDVVFAVGQVTDNTGKETYNDGGSGKIVTQGAGDMVQSALFRAGVTVVNRSSVNVSVIEATWGIRDITSQVPVNFYISGSINSIHYIPGGGYAVSVAGFGPKKRQSRILIGLDLSLVDAFTGRVVASIPLQKQIFMKETGFGGTNFFGDTLVSLDAGGMEREATNFALRQMVSLATFELLGQVMNPGVYEKCSKLVPGVSGSISYNGTADPIAFAGEGADNLRVPVTPAKPPAAGAPATGAPAAGPTIMQAPPAATPDTGAPTGNEPIKKSDAELLGEEASKVAARAISTAKEADAATDPEAKVKLAAEAIQFANLALRLLQEAARQGLAGEAGDVAAVVVQEAMKAATAAGHKAAEASRADAAPQVAPDPAPSAPPSPRKSSTVSPEATNPAGSGVRLPPKVAMTPPPAVPPTLLPPTKMLLDPNVGRGG